MTVSIMTVCITINKTQPSAQSHSVFMLNVIYAECIVLCFIVLGAIMLNVIMLSVVMLNVMAPSLIALNLEN